MKWPWLLGLGAFYVAATILTHFHKLGGAAALVAGIVGFHRPLGRILRATLVQAWLDLNREAAEERAERPADEFDFRVLVVLVTTAVSLTLIEYFGDRDTFRRMGYRWFPGFTASPYYDLAGFAYWSAARFVGYVVLPWLTVLAMPGERLRDYGLSPKGFLRHLWVYGVLFAIVLLPVVMVSYTKAFQHTYPFYKLAARSWGDYFAWEGLYGLQFLALEIFFRGYMIHPLRRAMGSYAILTMAVPYCMIHYHKPLPEVLGAVAAGTVLGTLSLSTGSIWCGVLIHVSVAWTMDGLALHHTAGYPGNPQLVL